MSSSASSRVQTRIRPERSSCCVPALRLTANTDNRAAVRCPKVIPPTNHGSVSSATKINPQTSVFGDHSDAREYHERLSQLLINRQCRSFCTHEAQQLKPHKGVSQQRSRTKAVPAYLSRKNIATTYSANMLNFLILAAAPLLSSAQQLQQPLKEHHHKLVFPLTVETQCFESWILADIFLAER